MAGSLGDLVLVGAGGFTTFSTFGHETLALLRDGERLAAAGNVVSQLVVGLGCAWAGYALASST